MELMARMSPKCSMAGAMATGTMNRMASRFQVGRVKFGQAIQAAAATFSMETRPKSEDST